MKGFRVWGLATSKILALLFVSFVFLYPIPYTLYPTHAAGPCPTVPSGGIDLGGCFGFGTITSLGQGTSKLVGPAFSIAAAIVVIYFLLGAFKYMRAEANKEELEGARNMIIHAIIGFFLLMLIFFILPFVLARLFGITNFQLF